MYAHFGMQMTTFKEVPSRCILNVRLTARLCCLIVMRCFLLWAATWCHCNWISNWL